jgi:predicted O-methyltransferase YrrM
MRPNAAGDADSELRARIEAAISSLDGWATFEKGARLAALIIETDADLSVEIGVFGGRATLAMAIAHQVTGRGQVVAIDPWEASAALEGDNAKENDEWWAQIDYDAIYERFVTALVHHGLVRQCRIMRERSDTAVRLFSDASISVLHQDGNHSDLVSTAEVDLWAPKVAHGGYWIFDDTDWPTTARAQERLIDAGFALVEDYTVWRVYQRS